MSVIEAHKRKVKKVAVLGSGVMGSALACHFANAGLQVCLLDIVTPGLSDEALKDPSARNQLVNQSLQKSVRSNPAPLYSKKLLSAIKTGNFEDDMSLLSDCDWIIEAVVERLDIKMQVFEKVEQYRKAGSLITSNTSGIPIEFMLKGRSEDFQQHFCGTHFFNPPRYLRLLEIIPSSKTHPEVLQFFMHFGDLFLGKETVLCKDTPAFIANRVGVFSIMAIFRLMEEMGMSIEEVDAITGPVSGRPKSATFRTCDVVGIDTLVKVARGVGDNCPDDEAAELYQIPAYVEKMLEQGWLGEKSGQGFYKKSKDAEGNRIIEALNLKSFEYAPKSSPRFASVGEARKTDSLKKRLRILSESGDQASEFFNRLHQHLFAYAAHRTGEIADHLYQIDDAMRAGFGWDLGPFEIWDVLSVRRMADACQRNGNALPAWVLEMLEGGINSFYTSKEGRRYFYNIQSKSYELIPGQENTILLDNYRSLNPVWKNKGCTLHDIGDGVLCLEFHTKMNSIGGEVLQGINKSIAIAEEQGWKGLVIGNDAPNFSAGANIAMIFMLALEQEWDELNMAIRQFQKTVMRLRYSSIPVVIAPHGLTLGGGCEMTLHADAAVAAAETYIGLVEFGVGVIPGGGGTKEFVLRASDHFGPNDPQLPTLQERFTTIATAKVATSAMEAFDYGYLHHDKDEMVINQSRLIAQAKQKVIDLWDAGYVQPTEREDIMVLGRTALGALYAGVEAFSIGNYASEHDKKIARKLAWVMAGGDLSQPTLVSEQYLLDLEREAFLSLCGERKTLERLQSMLKTGKPLRN